MEQAQAGKGKGRHPKEKLSAVEVRQKKTPGRFADGNGLYLVVDPSGAKRWLQRIMIRGRRCDLGLGSVDLVSLSDARKTAAENRAVARSGGDPLAERRRLRKIPTFEEAAAEKHKEIAPTLRSEKARIEFIRTLENEAFPAFGKMAVNEIMSTDVRRVIKKTKARAPEVAKKLLVRVRQVFEWCVAEGHRSDNPATAEVLALGKWEATGSHYPAVSLSDLPRWWSELAKREGSAAAALQFLTLTAARSGEVRGMTWGELDLGARMWIIPAVRMKSDREHRVPLSSAAIELIREQSRQAGNDLVFPAPRGDVLSDMSLSAVMRRMQADEEKSGRSGFLDARTKRPAVPHGIRSTFRDWAAECGHDWAASELALAHHVGGATERAYRRTDMVERRRIIMDQWADVLFGSDSANVVQFRSG